MGVTKKSSAIEFERLLRSCEDIANGDAKGRDDLIFWKSSPVYHHVRCLMSILSCSKVALLC